jgi:hypothetical protein
VRAVGLNLAAEFRGKFPCILCGSNPGNIGHEWVKRFWIDNARDLQIRRMPESEGGMLRQLIKGRIEDNPSLVEDDPMHELKLAGLGSPELVRAMRFGDWDIIEGAFFPEFARNSHVIQPFRIPEHWTRSAHAPTEHYARARNHKEISNADRFNQEPALASDADIFRSERPSSRERAAAKWQRPNT